MSRLGHLGIGLLTVGFAAALSIDCKSSSQSPVAVESAGAVERGASGGGGDDYSPCGGKDCGEPCSLCEPGEADCVESPGMKACDFQGRCMNSPIDCGGPGDVEPQQPTNAYAPCANKVCGERCQVCPPASTDCVETMVLKACTAQGECMAGEPACSAPAAPSTRP